MKKYLFGILAVVLALGFTAFTTKKGNNSKNTTFMYVREGTGNQFEISSYTLYEDVEEYNDVVCSNPSTYVCKFTSPVQVSPVTGNDLLDLSGSDGKIDAINDGSQTAISPVFKNQ